MKYVQKILTLITLIYFFKMKLIYFNFKVNYTKERKKQDWDLPPTVSFLDQLDVFGIQLLTEK